MKIALALAFGVSLLSSPVLHAEAAPINCPSSQVATHDAGDQWDCVNKAGHDNQSDQEKNANHPN